jgi:site-specific DNA-methyltransferase (adenine-specific)
MQKEFITLKLSDIHPYPNNPRINEGAVADVIESIKQCGNCDPIEIDDDNIILSGHTRLMALEKLRYDKTEVVRYTGLTEEQKKKYRLLANKTSEKAEWNFEALEMELQDLDFGDFDFGFDIGAEDEPTEIVEDDVPDVPQEPKTKIGDLWKLGSHFLICGDSTDVAVIDRLMDGVKADMVFTDSPYGINAVGDNGEVGADFGIAKKGKYKKIIADDTTETAQQAYDIYSQLCDKMILWGGNYFLDFLPPSDGWLIWDKRGESGIRNTFADGEMAWCSFHTPVRIYHQLWNGMIREGEHEKRVHPTQKPIRMLSEILRDFTNEGDIILDVFGGSGSTLIAREQTGRTCYMAELSPEYVDVIIARYEKLTGNKAVLLT